MGVWDTFDAAGLLFDDLTEALDRVYRVKRRWLSPGGTVQFAYTSRTTPMDVEISIHTLQYDFDDGDPRRLTQHRRRTQRRRTPKDATSKGTPHPILPAAREWPDLVDEFAAERRKVEDLRTVLFAVVAPSLR